MLAQWLAASGLTNLGHYEVNLAHVGQRKPGAGGFATIARDLDFSAIGWFTIKQ